MKAPSMNKDDLKTLGDPSAKATTAANDQALRFCSDFAHEINNLLLIIQNTISFAWNRHPASKAERDALETVTLAVKKASLLTCEMLVGNGMPRAFSGLPTAPAELVGNCLPLIRGIVSRNNVLKIKISENLHNIKVDRDHFAASIINLVKNADEALAGRHDGRIEIAVFNERIEPGTVSRFASWGCNTQNGDGVVVSVSDNGGGVSEETLCKMLQPNFTTKINGHGIGLVNVRDRVKMTGGGINIASVKGGGFRFESWFPATKETPVPFDNGKKRASSSSTRESCAAYGSRKPCVLMFDDDEAILRSSALMLESMQVNALMANSADEAVNVFNANKDDIDIVFLDANIGNVSSVGLMEEFIQVKPEIPIVVMSGYSESKVRAVFPEGSYSRFLAKPYTRSDFWEIVNEFATKPDGQECAE